MMTDSIQTFLDILSTLELEFEEFGSIALTDAHWKDADIILDFEISQQDHPKQKWFIYCKGVRNSRISHPNCDHNFSVETAHPLLLPLRSPIVELYFNGRSLQDDKLMCQLLEAHRRIVGGWFDFTHFLNVGSNQSLSKMVEGGFGKFAQGPKELIEAYASILQSNGIRVSSPPARPPMWWDGKRWVEEIKPLLAIIFGESFVVSTEITAQRLKVI